MPRRPAAERERVLNFATRDISAFVMHTQIGYTLAQLKRGEWIRIHLYRNTDNSGNEHPCGTYQRDSVAEQMEMAARALNLNLQIKIAGADVLVGVK